MCLPFTMMPSITALSSLNDQYALMSWCTCSLLSSQPAVINPLSCCKCSSCAVACCIYWTDMHSGTFVGNCIASTLTYMPHIAASFVFLVVLSGQHICSKNSQPQLIAFRPCIDVSWGGCTGYAVTGLLYLS